MSFEILNRKPIYKGRIFELQKVQVRTPDGRQVAYDLIHHPGSIGIVPLDTEGNILFVRQFRVGIDDNLLEIPAGTLEAGELPEKTASRELREETGMAANHIRKIGEFFLAPGYTSEKMHLFLAQDPYPAPLQPDKDEFITLQPIPIQEAFRMAKDGEIRDAKTLAALLLVQAHLDLH